MAKQEAPILQLQDFLPDNTIDKVLPYLREHKVHLTITRARKTILGDYRHRTTISNHRISVNGNLNPYAFLITLLHELAHLITFEIYRNRVAPHGKEWKAVYAEILRQFTTDNVFPEDIEKEVQKAMQNPAASSCAEEGLLRVLRKYDKKNSAYRLVEEIEDNGFFITKDGRVFQKIAVVRKRYRCLEVATGKVYLFSPVYEVKPYSGK